MGILSDDGYDVRCTIQGQEVNETDAYGLTLVEAIYRGQNWRIVLRDLEWSDGALNQLQMFGQMGPTGTLKPFLGPIGDRWSAYCDALVLTAILGFPPTLPQSFTALTAGFAPNSQSQFLMTSKVRELGIELVLLPYQAVIGSETFSVPFTTT